ncbi:ATP-binding SpoIIE family protein phosphatase [Paucibacter sp. R3-3]|uniref:ATP-binding SpoIIE family protein phosphatase n=1 Tax=Roseateles agri TaxID=3098619 RepID=A0ABU5DHX1_9BURK|nr:ATP-binding SpoIIE family protein phosphatase [Paucibacter sp. R3-3]MDY0745894.1 ATP-binding SpoIIE family protein phosphatase [Paucibacter sp. R3-3]
MNSAGHPWGSETAVFRLQSMLDLRMAASGVMGMASLARCSPLDLSQLATLVSELGSNILKYAGSGHIRVQTVQEDFRTGVEVVAEDNGPGIPDIAQAMQEHYSSSGTLGLGLSGVRRMVSEFHIDSEPGRGCRVRVQKWMAKPAALHKAAGPASSLPPLPILPTVPAVAFDTAEINRPCYPESVSGDSTVVQPVAGGLLLGCIDASGHGPRAHALSTRLAQQLRAVAGTDMAHLLWLLHQSAVGTIGAAAAIAFVDTARSTLAFAGIGNIRIRCVGAVPWAGICRDGVLGERFPTPEVQQFQLHAGDVVLLYSDGIRETLSTQVLARAHLGTAAHIADNVLQHGGKSTDDASCVVLKCRA